MTTPQSPQDQQGPQDQQDPQDQQGPQDQQDPQDPQDPTRAIEEPSAAAPETDDTAVIEDDATQRVETGAPVAAATSGTAWAAPVAAGTQPEPTRDSTLAPTPAPELPRPTGPHAPAIVLGVILVAIAVLVIAQEVGSLKVDWGNVGPLGIVAAGAMLVLFGLLGLLTSRRNQR